MTKTDNSIRKEVAVSPIMVNKEKGLYVSNFQKEGTESIELRQKLSTKSFYPNKKTESSMQDNLFDNVEFGFGVQEFESEENRVAWLVVPIGTTIAEIEERLGKAKDSRLYKVLSNAPILDENQQSAIDRGQRTIDDFAKTQAIRFPENTKTIADRTAGKLVLDPNGKVQYRKIYFSKTAREDVDLRGIDAAYVPADLQAELTGASFMASQTI